ncbi:hypothetical protein BU17DRAFT_62070 [Hysterangium stoloniferum]|nr:hypothetical protein BU17DRAFT_62070 [Hysterangium stoloniferum]
MSSEPFRAVGGWWNTFYEYIIIGIFTASIYDYLLTLPSEINLIWQPKVRYSTILYFMVRYLPVAEILFVVISLPRTSTLLQLFCWLSNYRGTWNSWKNSSCRRVILTLVGLLGTSVIGIDWVRRHDALRMYSNTHGHLMVRRNFRDTVVHRTVLTGLRVTMICLVEVIKTYANSHKTVKANKLSQLILRSELVFSLAFSTLPFLLPSCLNKPFLMHQHLPVSISFIPQLYTQELHYRSQAFSSDGFS